MPYHFVKQKKMDHTKRSGRRRLLKSLLATNGAGIGLLLLPQKWAKPIVELAVLPTHAQTTPSPSTPPTIPPTVPPHFQFELAGAPFTGQEISLHQDGVFGELVLRPGLSVPPQICQQNFAFVGNGYTVSVVGDRPVGDIDVTVTGKAENWTPGLSECSGVEMLALIDGPQNGCYATDSPLPYTIPNGLDSVSYSGYAPISYFVEPCQQGCNNVKDGVAGTITISDNAGVIPTLTISVMMQGSCI